ncbi:enoyl-CoA hydratase/carnithine racemase [Microbacterium trichothecenolyticum]|uniref:enoyl-CoA hydratase/isomerase family protein n=1 Tax=Microbacterium trichothecenolyticum TaxID=69370 RepID=UPI002854C38C|nr:enoyl-CoA hydratase-related protein [Microbacterium trichothecenolyticum]MDR7185214.1 enoyl-CoA hydratase/carnithine racemase [Microbacterium trichothecenolyticum]
MIDLAIDGAVADITLNAPEKLNALSLEALRQLDDAYAEAAASGVRALVLRGEGRAFCAGRDIAGVDPETDDVPGYLGEVERLMRRMAEFPAPTFAAVQGACLGVGLGLAIATDVVYVAESAKIGSPFANLGAMLDSGGHALLYERLGAHRALDLIYTGDLLAGSEAVAAGLFSRALPADEVLPFTRERAARAGSGATAAFLASKRLIARLRDEHLWDAVAEETRGQEALRATADYREGFAAFQQKRRPEFTGE